MKKERKKIEVETEAVPCEIDDFHNVKPLSINFQSLATGAYSSGLAKEKEPNKETKKDTPSVLRVFAWERAIAGKEAMIGRGNDREEYRDTSVNSR